MMESVKGTIKKQNTVKNSKLFNFSVKLENGNLVDAVSETEHKIGDEVKVERKFYVFWFYQII